MASPHIAGIAATLLEHYADFRNRPHLLRAHLMASMLLHDNTVAPRKNTSGGRNDYGLSRVSDYIAHWAHNNANGWSTKWARRTVSNSSWAFYDLTVPTGTDRLVVVMSWDEPAASAGAARAVLYDLDLWAGFGADCVPDSRGQCGERASRSGVDNTEYLIISNPAAGIYRLKIVNWRAPSFGLPAAIAAVIVRGDPTPAMTLSATPSAADPPVGSTFTVKTSVSSPSYVTSGAHLKMTGVSGGLQFLGVSTTREDGVASDFGLVGADLGRHHRARLAHGRLDIPGPDGRQSDD